jgi:hypothetical protein
VVTVHFSTRSTARSSSSYTGRSISCSDSVGNRRVPPVRTPLRGFFRRRTQEPVGAPAEASSPTA